MVPAIATMVACGTTLIDLTWDATVRTKSVQRASIWKAMDVGEIGVFVARGKVCRLKAQNAIRIRLPFVENANLVLS